MNLNRNHFADLFRADYKTVSVTFDESTNSANAKSVKRYTYKANRNTPIAVGDKLLVLVKGYQDEYKIVTVREVNETPTIDGKATFDYKWIVGPINTLLEQYNANIARDQQLKAAVAKLEFALERRMLRTKVEELLNDLPAEEAEEFRALFAGTAALPGAAAEGAAEA